jgi:hypothetical protein
MIQEHTGGKENSLLKTIHQQNDVHIRTTP